MTRRGLFFAAVYWAARACGHDTNDAMLSAVSALLAAFGLYADLAPERLARARRLALSARGWTARAGQA